MENKNPIVTIEMENGKKIVAELYPNIAPNTVKNFVSLIEKGYYNGVGFHRVIPGFMIQGGCPNGVLSMARTMVPNSAGSQFFIMHQTSPHLDREYASFGRVIEGMDVVDEIANTRTDRMDKPKEPQVMKTVTVETFGQDYSDVEKM